MAVAAAEKQHGKLDEDTVERIKAMSAATDNIGRFFGEDIFLAIASILLIQGSLASFGIQLTPFQLSVWAIPSAICAFVIHGSRLLWMDRQLEWSSMINLHWLYLFAGAVFAAFAIGSAFDESNREALGQHGLLGPSRDQLLVRRFPWRFGQRRPGAGACRNRRISPSRQRIEGVDDGQAARELL